MSVKILTKINVLLGVLAAFFAGCHTQSHTVRDRGPEAMYGVPQEVLDQMQNQGQYVSVPDSTATEQQVSEENRPEFQPRKYGPMPPREE